VARFTPIDHQRAGCFRQALKQQLDIRQIVGLCIDGLVGEKLCQVVNYEIGLSAWLYVGTYREG